MCRYGEYGPYKDHYACFHCRKGSKRPAASELVEPVERGEGNTSVAPCPQCGEPMANMGLDFKPPRRDDVEHWEVVAFLFRHGFAYHSCGCGGPGARPSRWRDVPAFLEEHRCRTPGEILLAQIAARSTSRRGT